MVLKNKKVLKIEKINESQFICSSDHYSIIGEGKSPELAIKSFERQQKTYLNKIKKLDLEESNSYSKLLLKESNLNLSTSINWKTEILLHFIKSSLTILIIVLIFGYMFSHLSKSLESYIDKMTAQIETEAVHLRQMVEFQIGSLVGESDQNLLDKLEEEINRGAENEDIEPDRKARIIENLNIISERYKPYMKAIKNLFSD